MLEPWLYFTPIETKKSKLEAQKGAFLFSLLRVALIQAESN
tara:strand:- start:59 stop:181 length:123 start_codon:yes stop_codon:yes gene_type:complete